MHTRRIRKALSHFAADVTPRYRRDTEYLLSLVRNERAVGRDPQRWLPWNYAAPEVRQQAA